MPPLSKLPTKYIRLRVFGRIPSHMLLARIAQTTHFQGQRRTGFAPYPLSTMLPILYLSRHSMIKGLIRELSACAARGAEIPFGL